jgi:DNA-binding response OmpR family regulator
MSRLLLVEDNQDMSHALTRALSVRGFVVTPCLDGSTALKLMKDQIADVVILDLSIPQIDGLDLLQRIRSQGVLTPVLILTARGSVGDRVAGLNAGADDYLSKPFDLNELEARLRALVRRTIGGGAAHHSCGNLRYDRVSETFHIDGALLEFSPREHALMKALIARPGHAVPKDRLAHMIFSANENVQSDAIDVIVHRVRRKLQDSNAEIMTLRGLGYLLRETFKEPSLDAS